MSTNINRTQDIAELTTSGTEGGARVTAVRSVWQSKAFLNYDN